MAFTFVVEDGTGTNAAANSYVSVAEADDLITANIHVNSRWIALSEPDRQRLLVWASRYIDTQTKWRGEKTVTGTINATGVRTGESPLDWPRTGVCDRNNVLIGPNQIPSQLKLATAEMARYLIDSDRSVERDQDGLERVKADVVEIEFLPGYRLPQVPNHMQYLIDGLGAISGGTFRFAKAVR